MKIKHKLSLQFNLLVVTLLLGFSLSVFYFISRHREKEFYERLHIVGINTAKLLFEINEIDSSLLNIIDANSINTLYQRELSIFEKENLIYSTADNNHIHKTLNNEYLQRNQKNIYKGIFDKNQYIIILYRFNNKEYSILVSAYDLYGYEKLKYIRFIIILSLLSSIILVSIIGKYFAGKALHPMKKVIQQVKNIDAGNLNARLKTGKNNDEIDQLIDTFNDLLGRIEKAFENQKLFVSNASHELRTPLTSITGQIEVSLMSEKSIDQYKEILISILEDIKTLNSLANGLLDLTQYYEQQNVLNLEEIRIDEILLGLQHEINNNKSNYTININFEGIDDDERYLTVHSSATMMNIIIQNLIENACKFSSNHTVEIVLSKENGFLKIQLSDKGIGIPEDELNRIFEPFYRAKNAKQIKGHGIGLSLVKKLIQIQNGRISIHSKLNKGTTVILLLKHL